MKKNLFGVNIFAIIVSMMMGCATQDVTLQSVLMKDTYAVSSLEREQQSMVSSKASPSDVYEKGLQADSYLDEIHKICSKLDKDGKYLSDSCTFYRELSFKFAANMMLTAGTYYLKNGDREKSEQILQGLVVAYPEDAYKAETSQARLLLEKLKIWGTLAPGKKAFFIGDYGTALRDLKLKDDPESLYYVGQIYYFGSGIAQDKKQASAWFHNAAEKGYAAAQYRLGLLYLYGDGVEQDETEAKNWLQKAATQGHPKAKEVLGSIQTK